jgi:hypothetical protein
MAATINFDDIPPDHRKEVGLKTSRESTFTKDESRGRSLKILA